MRTGTVTVADFMESTDFSLALLREARDDFRQIASHSAEAALWLTGAIRYLERWQDRLWGAAMSWPGPIEELTSRPAAGIAMVSRR